MSGTGVGAGEGCPWDGRKQVHEGVHAYIEGNKAVTINTSSDVCSLESEITAGSSICNDVIGILRDADFDRNLFKKRIKDVEG